GPDTLGVLVENEHGPTAARAAQPSGGRGVLGMRSRVAELGGTVQAGPWRGHWRVAATLPCAALQEAP
ncbi:MAG TPA: hypothetical protein VES42_03170, partial [Pilimelia sp.]|nr:hypothetical protein [Pilimelia sp.]